MLRRHLSNIIFLTLVIVIAGLYGLFVGSLLLPVWATVSASIGIGIVLAVVADPIANGILRWYDERQAVKAYEEDAMEAHEREAGR